MIRTPKYRLVKNNIREKNDNDFYLLKWSEQFSPYRYKSKIYWGCMSAYACYSVSTLKDIQTGFPRETHVRAGHLDHRIPNLYNGGDSGYNFQYLDAQINGKNLKGGNPTIAARWEAFRQGEEIESLEFVSPFVQFVKLFEFNYRAKQKGDWSPADHDISICWPWWLRTEEPPYFPYAPGFNHKTGKMEVSAKESYILEWKILAGNVLLYMEKCPIEENRAIVEYQFNQEYGMSPRDMAMAKVDWTYHHLFN